MALRKFSEVAKDGCCPKCGYAIMKRGVNAVTGNLAVGLAVGLASFLAATDAIGEARHS